MVPVAPARLSITHCCPVYSTSFGPRMRPIESVDPPAAQGMIRRTGFAGYSCAPAQSGTASAAAANRSLDAIGDDLCAGKKAENPDSKPEVRISCAKCRGPLLQNARPAAVNQNRKPGRHHDRNV